MHHVLPALALASPAAACRQLRRLLASFRAAGPAEWVGPFYPADHRGAEGYIASVANVRRAAAALRPLGCLEGEGAGGGEWAVQ